MIKKAVVLCGGLATRFLPISKSIPKEMLPILDKPIMQVVLEDLKQAGITDVLLIIGRNKECIVNHFDRNVELEQRLIETNKMDYLRKVTELNGFMNIYALRQVEPKGTGHCIKMAKAFVDGSPFVLMFGDEVLFNDGKNVVEQLIQNYDKYNKSVIATQSVDRSEVYRYGIISFKDKKDGAFFVDDMVEKPSIEKAPSTESYLGPAILTNDVYTYLDNMVAQQGKELVLTDALRLMAKEDLLMAQNIDGDRHDIGNKFGLVKVNVCAGLKDPEICEDVKKFILETAKKLV